MGYLIITYIFRVQFRHMNKKDLSERDICTKFINPAIVRAGWDLKKQVREEVSFTDGRIIVQGKMHTRGTRKRADYILYYKSNIPIAIIEAKDNNKPVGQGMQQALEYSEILQIPFVFTSNGDSFVFHDKTGQSEQKEKEIALDDFPTPDELWSAYTQFRGIEKPKAKEIAAQDYFLDLSDMSPRYYQQNAINRTVEAIAKEQDRILLVMATGTGKTYTAFNIIWRLWKPGVKKRILFLADRNALLKQTKNGDFSPFGNDIMHIIKNRKIDKSYQIYFALYQGLTGNEEIQNAYKEFSRDFFDLIVIDECHRGSASEASAWREVLDYFSSATQIGLTATPKETKDISNIAYFGEPVYTYSLKQGIDDGSQDESGQNGNPPDIGIDETVGEDSGPKMYYVNQEPVTVAYERVQYYGANSKLITESLKYNTKKNIHSGFASLDDFILKWNTADKKQKLLAEQGVLLEALRDEVG